MNGAAEGDFWWLLFGTLAVEVTLVVAMVTLLARTIHSPSWRRTVWQVALLGFAFMVAVECSGLRRVALFAKSREGRTDGSAELRFQTSVNTTSDLDSFVERLKERVSASSVSSARAEVLPKPQVWWPGRIWLLGFGGVIGWMVVARLGFLIFVRRFALRDEAVLTRVDTLARRLGLGRRVAVLQISGLAGPVAFGIVRPGVGLPEGFTRLFTATQQEAMLAHELAHLAAHDPLWHGLADVLAALLWWHPLVWIARRQLRTASEAAADEASLLVEDGPAALAECLVELGGRLTRAHSLGGLGMAGDEFRSGLGRRVKSLVTLRRQSWRPVRKTSDWLAKTVGLLAMIALVLAATSWMQPREAKAETVTQAFKESVLGLALVAAMPDPQDSQPSGSPGSSPIDPSSVNLPLDLDPIDWQPWSPAAVAEARAAGRPVLVNFTADWAVTGQVNEKTSLEVPVVSAKLREIGAVALKGDYTRFDEAITTRLRSFGRASVPLVLVYPADPLESPQLLPEILTPQIVLAALEQATEGSARSKTNDLSETNPAREQNKVPGLILEGKQLYEAGRLTEAGGKWREALRLDAKNPAANHYLTLLQDVRPEPTVLDGTKLVSIDPGRARLNQKLDSIVLAEVAFEQQTLNEAIENLAKLAQAHDPERKGVNIIINGSFEPVARPFGEFDSSSPKSPDMGQDISRATIRLRFLLRSVSIRQALDAVIKTATLPLEYSVESYAVVISQKHTQGNLLHTRSYKFHRLTLSEGLRNLHFWSPGAAGSFKPVLERRGTNAASSKMSDDPDALLNDVRNVFTAAGADFSAPGKQLFLNERSGLLMVRATPQELDIVEQAIQVLNTPPPQVTLDVKFCEVPEGEVKRLGFDWFSNEPPAGVLRSSAMNTGILTDPQYRVVLRALQQRAGVNVVSMPKLTALSGRQAQLKTVQVRSIVTHLSINRVDEVADTNSAVAPLPVAEPFELGPVLDVVPEVQRDGCTIRLNIKASSQEFLGYDFGTTRTLTMPDGRKQLVKSDEPHPVFRKRELASDVVVGDGQTVVLVGGSDRFVGNPRTNLPLLGEIPYLGHLFRFERAAKTNFVIFITPTLTDREGNRIQSPADAPNGVAPKP